jgi:predicted nucleotidyltransferase
MQKVPDIDRIIDVIVSIIQPDKIILFGSYARGDAKSDSDVDILILKKGITKTRTFSGKVHTEMCRNKVDTPVDIIVMDSDVYDNNIDNAGFIYKTINQEGIVVYGAA